jgi:hypothetical protein
MLGSYDFENPFFDVPHAPQGNRAIVSVRRYPVRQLTFQPKAVEATRQGDLPVEALDVEGSHSESASVQTAGQRRK